MEFVLVNKFYRVGKTEVSIQCDKPFTFFTRELEGDHLGDTDETLIEAVKEILRTELDPTSAIVKNQEQLAKTQEQLAKTTEALEKANQLMDGMQKVNLQNAQDIEDILARLEELEAQGEPDQAEKEEADEDAPQVTATENQAEEAQPTPAVEDNKESEKEDDISETTNQESPSEDNGGSNNE